MPKTYAVIGDPIAHSLSPVIHNKIFQFLGDHDRVYIALHITPRQLAAAVDIMRANFEGFNVTIPHKQAIIPFLDELTPEARRYGAVNTVKREGRRLIGHNTDGQGFVAGFQGAGWQVAGSRVLLIGAGGAARVAAHELILLGCELTIANRTVTAAQALAEELERHYPGITVSAVPIHGAVHGHFEFVVNATPVGMGDLIELSPIDLEELHGVRYVYDLIYNPSQTRLLRQGQELGCAVLNGLPMLVFQAALADQFWLGKHITGEMLTEVMIMLEEMNGNG